VNIEGDDGDRMNQQHVDGIGGEATSAQGRMMIREVTYSDITGNIVLDNDEGRVTKETYESARSSGRSIQLPPLMPDGYGSSRTTYRRS